MSKRRFRRQVSASEKAARYPTLDQLDRRGFLSHLLVAVGGAASLGAGLVGCDGRAVHHAGDGSVTDVDPEADAWVTSGKASPPKPDVGPEPDSWELMGGATAEDVPPRPAPAPDLGPDANAEEWEWDGFAGPPPPHADGGPESP